jgi:hypothetical protein
MAAEIRRQSGVGTALEPCHAQRVDHDVARHVRTHRPAHQLPAEQVDHHRQEQPAYVGEI